MYHYLATVEEIIKNHNLSENIHSFLPLERKDQNYTSEVSEQLLGRIQKISLLKIILPYLEEKPEFIRHNLLTSLLNATRTIVNTTETNYIAIINIKCLEQDIQHFVSKNSYFPYWKDQLVLNGLFPLYHMFLLETDCILELFKNKRYYPYSNLTIADFFDVCVNMVRKFIANQNDLRDIIHVFNYAVNQLHINYHYIEEKKRNDIETQLVEEMREVLVQSNLANNKPLTERKRLGS